MKSNFIVFVNRNLRLIQRLANTGPTCTSYRRMSELKIGGNFVHPGCKFFIDAFNVTRKRWRKPKGDQEWTIQSLTQASLGIRHRTKTSKTKYSTQKTRKTSNTDPTKNWWWTRVLAKGQQFLFLISHPPCYSYIVKSSKSIIDHMGKTKVRKRSKIYCHLRNLTLNVRWHQMCRIFR